MKLADILKDSNYKLSQFAIAEIEQLEQTITLKATKNGDVPYTVCLVRQKAIKLTPEEAIRQLYLRVLSDRLHYPLSRIQVEYGVNFGREVKRADIVVMDKDRPTTVYMLVELKKPKLKDGKDQLRSYCNATGAPIAVWTNGDQISYYQRKDPNYFEDIPGLPNANQTLADILQIKFTLEDLIKNDKLVKENKSLKTLIEEMEDEVLANAGVDVFEELFKLIFTKLYDEWYSGQGNRRSTRSLEFRNTGQTEAALKTKIQDLFDKAKKKWEGVFSEDAKISLTPSHLSVCVSSLENVKLFNSNLDVIDEAFEYLINQSSKGEKGQFFTPRYVIDLCVKMLNPQEDEYMIDTAAGSSGFPVHTIFHVWRQILNDEGLQASHLFSLEDKPPRCKEYVEDKVFAIDFDEKAVRVARTLNLIAGDGQTNVLHLNTLDYELWDEVTEQNDWDDIYHEGFKRLKRLRPKGSRDYREFQFDVLMANPPFAGDIKEPRMIARYDLAKKPDGKWQTKVGRDILFIERNLDFLKPGGRMAIVLPQGRFNNSSDKNIRDFIAERCRILAVVGLHGNTFKPHTGTKTSVLFVQKWNDDPKAGPLCPRQDDYNIFFATMRKSGKDNSGEKIWRKISSSTASPPDDELSDLMPPSPVQRVVGVEGDFLQDEHGHLVVDHDLYNHEGMTEDGIAEAFIEFAKKEKLSFFESSPSVTPFDAVKYQQLMDGLEAVEIMFSEIMEIVDFRIDSDSYRKYIIKAFRTLESKSYWTIKELAKSVINFGAYSLCNYIEFIDEGFPFLVTKDIFNNIIDFSQLHYISEEVHHILHKSHCKKGQILLTMAGAYLGQAAVFDEDFECSSNQAIAKITLNKNSIARHFLSTFINCTYGQAQIDRLRTGTGQPNINLGLIQNIRVPILAEKFQNYIDLLVITARKIYKSSNVIYQQAEDLLLSDLGLKDWQLTEETIAVKSFAESFLSSGRLDAEYYQPKQQKVMAIMGQSGLCIGNVVSLAKRKFQPEKQGTFNYIEIGNLNGEGFANSEVVPMEEAPSRAQWIVKTNDVITSTVRPIRRLSALIETDQNNYICSSGFAVLKPTKIEPEVLLVYLRSPIVCEILDLHTTASMYPAISTEDLLNIPFALPQESTRQKIAEKIRASRKAREQSKQLLEIAKTGVERAIETDETTATTWINQELEALEVELT
ncbi:N-6 DNA methylase [Nostoc sp. LEGE 12450]|uniref:N-6 DNA methylase n=1 Tax=Nostoc sp. LEGE 12450 TaxID=1828643 RepID=UPI00187E9857|nr:N-6 DNA methylase [Nostoc sp. LEGE 12450]MBE8988163.1 N-6 DNA methylase [Nostoc sp. LEGE 12450]